MTRIWFAMLLLVWLLPVSASAQMAHDVTMQSSWDVAQVRSSLPLEGASLAREGDALILRYRGSATAVTVCCGLQLPLHRLGDSDVWVLKVSVPDLDRAVLSLDLMIETPTGTEWLARGEREWRGPEAAPPVSPPKEMTGLALRGTLRTVWLAAEGLATGGRDVTFYRPPDELAGENMPVLYVMDGAMVEGLMPYVEPLIPSGAIAPTVFVGVHSLSGEARWHEYTPRYDDRSYASMVSFVVDTVLPWAEQDLHASSQPVRRGIFGVSNGADFALSLSIRQPRLFGTVIGFSAGTVESGDAPPPTDLVSRYYLEAGTLEPDFLERTSSFDRWLQENGVESQMVRRVAGHDFVVWREELLDVLRRAFGDWMQ